MKLLKKLCCPLLFSLFFVAALFFPVAFVSADDTVDLKLSEGTYRYDYAYEVFKLVNEERARVHLEPLVMDEELTEAAMQRAAETHAIFSHTRPDGSGCSTICPARMRGENIAYGQDSPSEVMDAWMTSSGHRANIIPAIPTSASAALYRIPVFSGFRLLVTTPQPALMSSSPTAKYLPLLPSACRISTSFSARQSRCFLQKRLKPCR